MENVIYTTSMFGGTGGDRCECFKQSIASMGKGEWLFINSDSDNQCAITTTEQFPTFNGSENGLVNFAKFRTITKTCPIFNWHANYTSVVNDWLHRLSIDNITTRTMQRWGRGCREWQYLRICQFKGRYIITYGASSSLKIARFYADYAMYHIGLDDCINVQMDGEVSKESEQGLSIQESDKAENTIITRDQAQTVSSPTGAETVQNYASTEKIVRVSSIVNRWMPLETISITTVKSRETVIHTYYLPETIFKELRSGVNLLPFETFLYSKLKTVFKFVVNANKFQTGKVLVSVKFDSYQADAMQASVQAGLGRPHIILDLATNNEGVLEVPFRYHRAFVRNVKNDKNSVGIRPSKYATVLVQILSPLTTGKDCITDVNIRPFVKFEEADFAGMSYRVAVQMDTVCDSIASAVPVRGIKTILKSAEAVVDQIGKYKNYDKPRDPYATIIVPRPRLNFTTGKGLSDAIPLRLNPNSLTSFATVQPYSDEPRSTLEIAQIWGLRNTFKWNATHKAGDELMNITIDPTARFYNKGYEGNPTPLEYVCGMYNFWAGTIEIRLDFVSNAFHTGSVMLAAEFMRPTTASNTTENEMQTASTYTKTFHLGEQKSVTFTVPYIYDTVWRRTNALTYQPLLAKPKVTDAIKNHSITIRPESNAKFRLRVINELRPVCSTTQEIEVLLFWRASENFCLHSLKQQSFYLTRETSGTAPSLDSFPADGYAPVVPQTLPNAVGREKRSIIKHTHDVPAALANEWNEVDASKFTGAARVQMDNGEKEDQDPTEDFNLGLQNLVIQTSDAQVNIKDILRRPTMMVYRQKVDGNKNTAHTTFFLPLMPPSREMASLTDTQPADKIWFPGMAQCPTTSLMNLFRFWRGSMRYTIVVETSTPMTPIYITHVPHSGTRLIGNRIIGTAKSTNYIMGSGLNSEFILPMINSSVVVEAPYDTENNWSLTFEENAQRNYSWRDKGDTNSGHIAITSHDDVYITVWWSAADDFEVANFYGIPTCKFDDSMYAWSDAHARVQMDFRSLDNTRIPSVVSDAVNIGAMAAVSAIPVIGPGLAIATKVHQIEKQLGDMNRKVTDTLESVGDTAVKGSKAIMSITNVADGLNERLTTLDQVCANGINSFQNVNDITVMIKQILEKVSNVITPVTNSSLNILNLIQDFILDLVNILWHKSIASLGLLIVRTFKNLIPHDMLGKLIELGNQFVHCVTTYLLPRVQAPASPTSTLVGLIAAIVGLTVGVHINPLKYWGFETILGKILKALTTTESISYVNQVIRLVQTCYDVVKTMVLDALGYVDPQIHAMRMICENSTFVDEFVVNSQKCLNEVNSRLLSTPRFRNMFYTTTVRAYQIQRAIVSTGTNSTTVSPLLKICSDVIKCASEKFVDLSCSPVRYEPFVICLTGQPGIGKSYLAETLATELLKAINFTRPSDGCTFTRVPGAKYWSGYRDQPCIIYDDWMNLNSAEHIASTLSEMYQLKSTCQMIPEMAHLEEKKIKANPRIVILLCNDAFPTAISNVALHKDAIYRRRDIVLHLSVKDEFSDIERREMTQEQSATFAHLKFSKYKNVIDQTSLSTDQRDFTETMDYLTKRFKRYDAQERKNVERRLDQFYSFMQTNDVPPMGDPFSLFYAAQQEISVINQNAWLPSEQLEVEVENLIRIMSDPNVMRPAIIVPDEPEEIFVQSETIIQKLLEYSKQYLSGLLLNIPLVATLVSLTWDQVVNVIHWIHSKTLTSVQARCCICFEDMAVSYVCTDSLSSEAPHYLCASCTRNHEAIGNGTCPVCRSHTITIISSANVSSMYVLMEWIRVNALDRITYFVRAAVSVFKWYDMTVLAAVVSLSRMLEGNVSMMDAGFVSGTAMTWFTNSSNITQMVYEGVPAVLRPINVDPTVQVDDWDDHEDNNEPPEEERHITFDMSLVEQLRDVDIDRAVRCRHSLLIEHVHSANYAWDEETNQGIFQVYTTDEETNSAVQLIIQQGACCEECPFAQNGAVEDFYLRWYRTHAILYTRSVNAYENALTEDSRLRARKRIPAILWPYVMRPIIRVQLNRSWWEYLSDFYAKYKLIINICAGVGIALTTMYSVTRVINYLCGKTSLELQSYDSTDSRQLRQRITPRQLHANTITVQADDVKTVAMDKIYKNYITARIWKGDKEIKYMTLVGLIGKIALLPNHYYKVLDNYLSKPEYHMTLEPTRFSNGKDTHMQVKYNYCNNDFRTVYGTEVCLMKLPNSYPSCLNIHKFIQRNQDVELPIPEIGTIVLAPTKKRTLTMLQDIQIEGIQPNLKLHDTDDQIFYIRDVLKYNHSEPGACGSLLLTNTQRPIRSMHIAGTSVGEGYGALLTFEMIEECLQQFGGKQLEEETVPNVEMDIEEMMVFDENCNVDYIGVMPVGKRPHIPKKSKIRPSVIQQFFPTKTQPAILSKDDPRYEHPQTPLWYGAAKHGKQTRDFNSLQVERVKSNVYNKWFKSMRPLISGPKRLSIEDAILGFDGIEFYDAIKMNTSAGYPWQMQATGTLKGEWIDIIDRAQRQVTVKKKLRAEIIRKEELRKKGIVPATIFVDTLKDERKKMSKLLTAGGTRVFCASPVDYTIAMRQNLLHFTAAFMANRLKLPHAVGINARGVEWTELFKKLCVKSPKNIIMMDYSNFGPAFNAVVAEAAADIMIMWSKENVSGIDEVEMRALLHECINSIHVAGGTVYRQFAGSPSGAAITTIINSLVNILYISLAWDTIVQDYNKWQLFDANVYLCVYGDDLIMSVTDKYKEVFNTNTIMAYFSEYNIVATSADKENKNIAPVVDIYHASFLKRSFKKHEERSDLVTGPLDKEALEEIALWIWATGTPKEATRVNVESALMEAHAHGKAYFDNLVEMYNTKLVKVKARPVNLCWHDLDDMWFEGKMPEYF